MGTLLRLASSAPIWDWSVCLAADDIPAVRFYRILPFENGLFQHRQRSSRDLRAIGDLIVPPRE
jgi:hypothetical protein